MEITIPKVIENLEVINEKNSEEDIYSMRKMKNSQQEKSGDSFKKKILESIVNDEILAKFF